jgi:hypothetical protein
MKSTHSKDLPNASPGSGSLDIQSCGEIRIHHVEPLTYPMQLVESFADLLQMALDARQAGRKIIVVEPEGLTYGRRPASMQDGQQMLRVPLQRQGQRLERARAAPTLHSVSLDLADDRLGYPRPFDEVDLSQTKLSGAPIDRACDRSPIFRHVFLRAPPRRRD